MMTSLFFVLAGWRGKGRGGGEGSWQVLMNVLVPWPLLNYRGIRNLPGVYELISLHGLSVQTQIMVSFFDGLSTY